MTNYHTCAATKNFDEKPSTGGANIHSKINKSATIDDTIPEWFRRTHTHTASVIKSLNLTTSAVKFSRCLRKIKRTPPPHFHNFSDGGGWQPECCNRNCGNEKLVSRKHKMHLYIKVVIVLTGKRESYIGQS